MNSYTTVPGLVDARPPAWYPGARRGDERHNDGQAWWVLDVEGVMIVWGRSPDGAPAATVTCTPSQLAAADRFGDADSAAPTLRPGEEELRHWVAPLKTGCPDLESYYQLGYALR